MRTLAICVLAASALWGCRDAVCAVESQFNYCYPTSYVPCGGSWDCQSVIAPTQTYEIRCEEGADAGVPGAGMVCRCYRNGAFEREISPPSWCNSSIYSDGMERIPAANVRCGWWMSECGV